MTHDPNSQAPADKQEPVVRQCSGECELPESAACCKAVFHTDDGPYICTRREGHDGYHEACHIHAHPAFRWPNTKVSGAVPAAKGQHDKA